MAPTGPTAPTASGSGATRADRWTRSLILVVTRRCNLRCAYCPTAKDGEPDLAVADVRRAIDLFVERHGGGELKLFGGEPLLVPELVRAALDHAPLSVRVWLSTNGRYLDEPLLAAIATRPDTTLTVSLDGAERDHDGLRRGEATWATVVGWLPRLLTLPRFVVTQTIAPATAARAADNFRALRALGIRRFNLLPGYFLPWSDEQLRALETAFAAIAADYEHAWARGERLYLRNLFVRAPTPFYNTGFVVDSDRAIHPNNLVLAQAFDGLRERTRLGTLDDPPSVEALDRAAATVPDLLREHVPAHILASTFAVDDLLSRLCRRLYPAYLAARAARRAA